MNPFAENKDCTTGETLQDMSQSKLDYWLMKNIKIMEELSVEEPQLTRCPC